MVPQQQKLLKNLEDFFFVQDGELVICLFCNIQFQNAKKFRMQTHFHNHYQHEKGSSSIENKKKWREMKKNYELSQKRVVRKSALFKKRLATCRVAYDIAKYSKPFTDGDFIKKCAIDMLDALDLPDAVKKVKSLPLSRHSIRRRVSEIAASISKALEHKIRQARFFSIAVDESVDISSTGQIAIFIRGIDDEFKIFEELASIKHLKGRATGKLIFDEVIAAASEMNIDFKKLVSVTTDGCPSMVGHASGFVAHLRRKVSVLVPQPQFPFVTLHCLIHQEQLCKKSLDISHVTDIITMLTKYLRKSSLRHRSFKSCLAETEAVYTDIPYHTPVRWLSIGQVCQRVYEVLDQIVNFFTDTNDSSFPQLYHKGFVDDLAFVTDILVHLNTFNKSLQGHNLFIHESYHKLTDFLEKLHAWSLEVSGFNLESFHRINERKEGLSVDQFEKYKNTIEKLITDLSGRFADFHQLEADFTALSNIFEADVNTLRADIQLELIELQSNSTNFKDQFAISKLPEFFSSLDAIKYKNLKKWAQWLMVMFGSTYRCESAFSTMNFTKNKYRSQLGDFQLEETMKISITDIQPNFDSIVTHAEEEDEDEEEEEEELEEEEE